MIIPLSSSPFQYLNILTEHICVIPIAPRSRLSTGRAVPDGVVAFNANLSPQIWAYFLIDRIPIDKH